MLSHRRSTEPSVLSLEKQGDWYDIRTADGYKGWVAAADLKPLAGGEYAPEGKSVRVAGMDVNVYRDSDVTRHAPVLKLPWEARLELIPGKDGQLRALAQREAGRWRDSVYSAGRCKHGCRDPDD